MKHRFTYKEPSGTWGVHGEEFRNMSRTIYGAMCKLLDYEETGLSPDDIEDIQYQLEEVHIGKKIDGYEVFGMFNGCCIAFNKKAPDPYVVWTIDDDKCGVHGGRYRKTKEEAASVFAEYAFGIELPEPEDSALPEMPDGTTIERMRNCHHEFGVPKFVCTGDEENSERIRTAAKNIQKIRETVCQETEPDINEIWNNAPEIREDIFEDIITQLYNILRSMPRNSIRRHFKDVKISEYKKFLNL